MTSTHLPLKGRARLTFAAHLFKAVTQQHHRDLLPILGRLVPRDGVVFDVGGHAGQMAKLFAGLAPQGRVYTFEPGLYALAILRKVAALKGHGRIVVEPIAFGAAPGTMTLTTPIKRSGSFGFGLSHLGDEANAAPAFRHEVSVWTIDRFIEARGLTRLDFIKADIEGWELRMLSGATNALARLRPVVLVEAADVYLKRAGDSRERLWRFMRAHGYTPFRLEPGLPAFAPEADGDVIWAPDDRLAALGLAGAA